MHELLRGKNDVLLLNCTICLNAKQQFTNVLYNYKTEFCKFHADDRNKIQVCRQYRCRRPYLRLRLESFVEILLLGVSCVGQKHFLHKRGRCGGTTVQGNA